MFIFVIIKYTLIGNLQSTVKKISSVLKIMYYVFIFPSTNVRMCDILKLEHIENNVYGLYGCMILLPRNNLLVFKLVSHAYSFSVKDMPLQFSLEDSSWQYEIDKASIIPKAGVEYLLKLIKQHIKIFPYFSVSFAGSAS